MEQSKIFTDQGATNDELTHILGQLGTNYQYIRLEHSTGNKLILGFKTYRSSEARLRFLYVPLKGQVLCTNPVSKTESILNTLETFNLGGQCGVKFKWFSAADFKFDHELKGREATAGHKTPAWEQLFAGLCACFLLCVLGAYIYPGNPNSSEAQAGTENVEGKEAKRTETVQPTYSSPKDSGGSSEFSRPNNVSTSTGDEFVSVLGELKYGTKLYNKYTHELYGMVFQTLSGQKVEVIPSSLIKADSGGVSVYTIALDRKFVIDNFVTKK